MGCILRVSRSVIVWVSCSPLGVCDLIKAEAMGLLMGLRELRKMGLIGCFVEGDSVTVIGWEKDKGVARGRLVIN